MGKSLFQSAIAPHFKYQGRKSQQPIVHLIPTQNPNYWQSGHSSCVSANGKKAWKIYLEWKQSQLLLTSFREKNKAMNVTGRTHIFVSKIDYVLLKSTLIILSLWSLTPQET